MERGEQLITASEQPLRAWQQQALDIALASLASRPVLIEACPGAGKTRFGLEIAAELLQDQRCRSVVILAPNLAVARGWIRASSRFEPSSPTIPLLATEQWRVGDRIPRPWMGAVTTYQSLAARSDDFARMLDAEEFPSLVIFDEVHHLGDETTWGNSAKRALARDQHPILALSGTPFRSDLDSIPFLETEDGFAVADYRYGYDQAVRDSACRPVRIVAMSGDVTFSRDDRTTTLDFESQASEQQKSDRLRGALQHLPPGSIAFEMLSHANTEICAMQERGDPHAAGIVVAMDCAHADKIADQLAIIDGRRPVVVCSTSESETFPHDELAAFRNSADPWLVTVNMASEGVDIPRLRVVVYLTNVLTDMRFRQSLGRVVRANRSLNDDHAMAFIPADSRMIAMAEALTGRPVLRGKPKADPKDMGRDTPQGDERQASDFEVLDSRAESTRELDPLAESTLMARARVYAQDRSLQGTSPEALAELAARHQPTREALIGGGDDG